ncbi:hypothetical protein FO519_001325 [Halicephalobus sp. NKZ332]|nr:hypothetical protein FO519_001325 [Halicephalobus sp. NKZ332]
MLATNPSSEEDYWNYKVSEEFGEDFSVANLDPVDEDFFNLPNIPIFEEECLPYGSEEAAETGMNQLAQKFDSCNPDAAPEVLVPTSPESGYNSDRHAQEYQAAMNQEYHRWSPELPTSSVYHMDHSQQHQLVYNAPYYPVPATDMTISRKRTSSATSFDDMNYGKRVHLENYQYVQQIPQLPFHEVPQQVYYYPQPYPSHVLPASEVPSFDQITANLETSHRRHHAQRQPSDGAILLDLNRTKFDRWEPTVAFLKQCLGHDRLIDFVCELLDTSGKCNKYVQWLAETSAIKSPRCFELKNTVAIAEMYSQRIGQQKSYKSMSNILSAGNWSWNGIVLLKKVNKNQRNKYELLPDLVYSSFGGFNKSRIEIGPDGRPMEVLTNM